MESQMKMRLENPELVFPSDSVVWNAKFPGTWLVSKTKVIFVRQCYIDLYALCRLLSLR
jgi:hypothetical protein